MIRINLLPTKRKKKAKPLPMYLIYSGVALVASLAVFFFVNDYMNNRIEDLKKDKTQKEADKKRLEDLVKSVKDFEAKKKELENKIRVILTIADKKSLPAKMFNDLSLRLDMVKGVWLSTMKYANEQVQLMGVAFDNNDAVNFRNQMVVPMDGASVDFTSVRLPGTQKVNLQGNTVFNFNMTMDVKLLKGKPGGGAGNGP